MTDDLIETIAREMRRVGEQPDSVELNPRYVEAMMVRFIIADVLHLAEMADDDYAPDGYCGDCGAKILGCHGCDRPFAGEED